MGLVIKELNPSQNLAHKDYCGRIRFEYGIEPLDENPRRRDEEVDSPRSPQSECSSRNVEEATCTKRKNTEEDGRDVQAKKNGNIQIK